MFKGHDSGDHCLNLLLFNQFLWIRSQIRLLKSFVWQRHLLSPLASIFVQD